jgi:hypothetical protein
MIITVYLGDTSVSLDEELVATFVALTNATLEPSNTDLSLNRPQTVSTNVDSPSEGNHTSDLSIPPVTPTSAQLEATETTTVEDSSEIAPVEPINPQNTSETVVETEPVQGV